jgi:hypothetical protein
MTKRVRVTLLGIRVEDGGDDHANDLEIQGFLGAERFSTNGLDAVVQTEGFWFTDVDHPITIHEATIFPMHVAKEMIIERGEILRLGGHLWDVDLGGYEDLGEKRRDIYYNDLGNGEYNVDFKTDSDGFAQAIFSTALL